MVRESLLHKSGGSGVSRRVGLTGVRHLSPEATLLTGPETEQEPRPGPACPRLPASAGLASPSLLEDPALTGEVLVQPGSEFLVSPHCQLPGVENTLWLRKMLSGGSWAKGTQEPSVLFLQLLLTL